MKRFHVRLAAAGALAAATALMGVGAAFAGGNPNAPGQQKKDAATSQSSSSSSSSSQTQGSPSQGSNGDASSPGMKPANNTAKGTNCTYQDANTCTSTGSNTAQANAKQDASKHYGNGKTAAQIAASKGVPAGSNIYGPGNSQPHKVTCPGSTKGPDVHAYKNGKHSCGTTTSTSGNTSSNNTSNTSSNNTSNTSSNNTSNTSSNTTSNTSSNTTSNTSVNTSTGTPTTGGVLGATTKLGKAKPAGHGGVLGTVTHVQSGTLPFTGFPVWLAMLIGVALIGGGLILRRRAAGASL